MEASAFSPCPILPPYLLREILRRGTPEQQDRAFRTLSMSEQIRGRRGTLGLLAPLTVTPTGGKRRTVYDAGGGQVLPGRLVRAEGDPRTDDRAANEAYDGSGATYDFLLKVFGRNSIDGRGMRLDSTVHYGNRYDNAFWNGTQMVYGDGDGDLFHRFTRALDVIAHELGHGISAIEAGLVYEHEPGALAESFSDVLGSLVKQHRRRQRAAEADWLIGERLLTRKVRGRAIRSMKEPGSAYDDPVLGKDPQPAHMRDFVDTETDNGGVHLNSGIPNRAFYETAVRLGGYAWQAAGRIWYVTLCDKLRARSGFRDVARMTLEAAREIYGPTGPQQQAVSDGWTAVGIPPARRTARAKKQRP